MKKVATIVECRNHPALGFVLDNFMALLPEEWEFQIFYCDESVRRRVIRDLPLGHGRKIHWDKIADLNGPRRAYNDLLLENEFWESCRGDMILMFQTDSILCKESKYKISDFEHHDFIGGLPICGGDSYRGTIMNGGLSLRRKQLMIDVPKPKKEVRKPWEDVFYSRMFGVKVEGVKFCWDHGFHNASEGTDPNLVDVPFALHKPWLGPKTAKAFEQWAEVAKLRKLNHASSILEPVQDIREDAHYQQ